MYRFSGISRPRQRADDYEDFDGDKEGFEYLQDIIVHEFGHALGLGHSDTPGNVMSEVGALEARAHPCPSPVAGTDCGLAVEDVKGAQAIYGAK